MITAINGSKTLTKHISCEVKCRFENLIEINGGIMIDLNVSVKNVMYVKNIILGMLVLVIAKMKNTSKNKSEAKSEERR